MKWLYGIVTVEHVKLTSALNALQEATQKRCDDGWEPIGGPRVNSTIHYSSEEPEKVHVCAQALRKPSVAQPDPAYIADQLTAIDNKLSAIGVKLEA